MGKLTLIPRRPTGRVVAQRGGLISNTYPLIGFGPELNPDPFFGDPSLWTFQTGWSIEQNVAKVSGTQGIETSLQILDLLEPETLYRLSVTFSAISAGQLRQAAGDTVGAWQTAPVADHVEQLTTGLVDNHLMLTADLAGIGDCTHLSCRRVLNP